MPVRETFIDDFINTSGFQWVRNIKYNAIARAGPGCNICLRKNRNIVALIGLARLLSVVPMVPTLPQTCQTARFLISKHCRAINYSGFGWVSDWNFDNVNSKKRCSIVTGNITDTSLEFLFVPDG